MLNPSIAVNSHRIHPLAIALSLVCLLFWADHGHAERFRQRGVAIPDAPDVFVQGTTHLEKSESGADLRLPLDASETWQLLNRVLTDLGIKPKQQDAQRQHLLTDWVLWIWDSNLETGRSKPPLKALTRTFERHHFEFSVSPAAGNTGALIHISDAVRQREVDITPDSEYTWLQWRDAPVQADAAWGFMRRLQGNFESALSSRLMPSTVASPSIIEPVRPSEPTREVRPVTPTSTPTQTAPDLTPATAAVMVAPASTLSTPAPVPTSPPVPKQQSNDEPDQSKPATVEHRQEVVDESSKAAITPGLPVPLLTVEPQSAEQQTPPRSERPQDTATQPPVIASAQLATPPLAVQGGLLVDGGLDATWQALLAAIDTLDIELQGSDQTQHMLTTQWTDARFDEKNQQLTLESKTEERWAFDLWGKGRQRHRFQLILIPADGGARTMVYAYHTGFQVETDQTPDSSQTLLYWKDHKTEPAIAMAFLRRLQLVVRQ